MTGSRLPSENIFQVLPSGFFNLLSGGSNQEIYSECLLLIYDQFEREISYRVERRQIREVLSSEKNYVERTINTIAKEYRELSMRGLLPEELNRLFLLDRNEFIDTQSIRFPGKDKAILTVTETEIEELTQELLEAAKKQQEREAFNPYEKEKMKQYFEKCLNGRSELASEELPVTEKTDLLATLSAVAYAAENGFSIEVRDGYLETNGLLLRRFTISKL